MIVIAEESWRDDDAHRSRREVADQAIARETDMTANEMLK
jgi:hypothetical protein